MKGDQAVTASVDSVEGGGLIFLWKRARNTRWKLAFFLLLSFAAHLFCFYLFQIAYPPSDRTVPTPASITFLSPALEENRAVLQQIQDRIFNTDPALSGVLNEVSLNDYAVKFRPSYEDYEFELKDLPSTPEKLDLPGLSKDSGGIVLPPVETPELIKKTAAVREGDLPRIGFQFFSPLADRLRVAEPQWKTLPLDSIQSGHLIFMLGVSESGAISHCLTLESSDPKIQDREVAEEVRQFKFEPASLLDGLQWGRFELFW